VQYLVTPTSFSPTQCGRRQSRCGLASSFPAARFSAPSRIDALKEGADALFVTDAQAASRSRSAKVGQGHDFALGGLGGFGAQSPICGIGGYGTPRGQAHAAALLDSFNKLVGQLQATGRISAGTSGVEAIKRDHTGSSTHDG